jgi:hypothetical protein
LFSNKICFTNQNDFVIIIIRVLYNVKDYIDKLFIAKEIVEMKARAKNTRDSATKSGMNKIQTGSYYPCVNTAVRHMCEYHCRKCFFEAAYCPK